MPQGWNGTRSWQRQFLTSAVFLALLIALACWLHDLRGGRTEEIESLLFSANNGPTELLSWISGHPQPQTKAAVTHTTQTLQSMNFDWGFVNPITNVSRVSCSDTVADGAAGYGRHLAGFEDLVGRFHGPVGTTYVVECPAHCGHNGAPVYGPGDGSFDDKDCSGLGENSRVAAFMDASSICRAAIAMRELGHRSSGLVVFRIVEPIPVYPACPNMPRQKLPASLPWREPYREDSTVTRVTSMKYVWHQWDRADRSRDIERHGGPTACCNDTLRPEHTSRGGCCAVQKYRQYWTGALSGLWYGVRAFEIIGGESNLALRMSGVVDASAMAPQCLEHLLSERGFSVSAAQHGLHQSLAAGAQHTALSVESWVRHLDDSDTGDYVSLGEWRAWDRWNTNLTLTNGVHLGMIAGRFCWSAAVVGGRSESVCAPEWVTAAGRGSWTHLAGTYDGSEMQLWVNGTKLASSTALRGGIAWRPNDLVGMSLMGMHLREMDGTRQVRSMFGEIDEVRVWKRVLKATDIEKSIGLTLLRPYHPDLVVYYRFDGQASPTALDEGRLSLLPEVGGASCILHLIGDVDLVDSSAPVELLTAATSDIIDPATNQPLEVNNDVGNLSAPSATLEMLTEQGRGLPPSVAELTSPDDAPPAQQPEQDADIATVQFPEGPHGERVQAPPEPESTPHPAPAIALAAPHPEPSPPPPSPPPPPPLEPEAVTHTCAELGGEQEDMSDKCFFVPAMRASWERGESECMKYGGHLASVNSEEESDVVQRLYVSSGAQASKAGIWIGISDDSHLLEYAHKNKWVWADGTDVVFSAWPPGEPKDVSSGHKCAMFQRAGSEGWVTAACSEQAPFVCALDTHRVPAAPKLELGLPLSVPPGVREFKLADMQGRTFKFDAQANVVRLLAGEELTFGVLAPPRDDSRHKYGGTDVHEYVALRVVSQDLYLRHQGYVTHLTPWQGYVADTRTLRLAQDYAWRFIDGGEGTWKIATDYGGWFLGYDADRDAVLIADVEADTAMHFRLLPVAPLPRATTTPQHQTAPATTPSEPAQQTTPPPSEPPLPLLQPLPPPPSSKSSAATEPPSPPPPPPPPDKDKIVASVPPLPPPPSIGVQTAPGSSTKAWPNMVVNPANWGGSVPGARSVSVARNAQRAVADGTQEEAPPHRAETLPIPAQPKPPRLQLPKPRAKKNARPPLARVVEPFVEEHWAVPVREVHVLPPRQPLRLLRPVADGWPDGGENAFADPAERFATRQAPFAIPQIQPGIQPRFFDNYAVRSAVPRTPAAYLPRYELRPVIGLYKAQPAVYEANMGLVSPSGASTAPGGGFVALGSSALGENFVEQQVPTNSGAE